MKENANKTIDETLEEKILRLEREIKKDTLELEKTNKKASKIEEDLTVINKKSEEIKNKVQTEEEKLKNTNERILEIEQQIKMLLKDSVEEEKEEKIEQKQEEIKENDTEATSETSSEMQISEEKIEEKLEKSLTPEENKILEKEIKNVVPEPFEPKEIKKNKGLFLKNLVVKSVSGIKNAIPEKLKTVASKLRNKVLFGIAVISLFAGTSSENGSTFYNISKDNLDGSKNSVSVIDQEEIERKMQQKYLEAFHLTDYKQLEQIRKDLNIKELSQFEKLITSIDTTLYNKLTPGARKIYLYALTNTNETYYIVDKPTATIYAVSPNGKEIGNSPVILGTMRGEEPNTADVDGSRYIGTTTPAGKYKIGHKYIHPSDSVTYKDRILSLFNTPALAIHIVYPGEYEARMAAINSPTPDDNRMSWGCTNVPIEFWNNCIAPFIKEKSTYTLFVTTDYQNINTLNPNTGKLEQVNNNSTDKNNIDNFYNSI